MRHELPRDQQLQNHKWSECASLIKVHDMYKLYLLSMCFILFYLSLDINTIWPHKLLHKSLLRHEFLQHRSHICATSPRGLSASDFLGIRANPNHRRMRRVSGGKAWRRAHPLPSSLLPSASPVPVRRSGTKAIKSSTKNSGEVARKTPDFNSSHSSANSNGPGLLELGLPTATLRGAEAKNKGLWRRNVVEGQLPKPETSTQCCGQKNRNSGKKNPIDPDLKSAEGRKLMVLNI